MTSLILPRRLTEQPAILLPPDYGNPLALGLVSATYATESNPFVDSVLNEQLIDFYSGDSFRSTGVNRFGRYRKRGSGSHRNYSETKPKTENTSRWTQLTIARPLVDVGTTKTVLAYYGSGGGAWYYSYINLGNGADRRFTGSAFGGTTAMVSADDLYTVGELYQVAYTTNLLVGDQRLFVNGVRQSGSNNYTGAAAKDFDFYALGGSGVTSAFELYASFFWNRILTDRELVELNENPWQLFKAPERKYFVAVAPQAGSTLFELEVTLSNSTLSSNSASTISAELSNTLVASDLVASASISDQDLVANLNATLSESSVSSEFEVSIASTLESTLSASILTSDADLQIEAESEADLQVATLSSTIVDTPVGSKHLEIASTGSGEIAIISGVCTGDRTFTQKFEVVQYNDFSLSTLYLTNTSYSIYNRIEIRKSGVTVYNSSGTFVDDSFFPNSEFPSGEITFEAIYAGTTLTVKLNGDVVSSSDVGVYLDGYFYNLLSGFDRLNLNSIEGEFSLDMSALADGVDVQAGTLMGGYTLETKTNSTVTVVDPVDEPAADISANLIANLGESTVSVHADVSIYVESSLNLNSATLASESDLSAIVDASMSLTESTLSSTFGSSDGFVALVDLVASTLSADAETSISTESSSNLIASTLISASETSISTESSSNLIASTLISASETSITADAVAELAETALSSNFGASDGFVALIDLVASTLTSDADVSIAVESEFGLTQSTLASDVELIVVVDATPSLADATLSSIFGASGGMVAIADLAASTLSSTADLAISTQSSSSLASAQLESSTASTVSADASLGLQDSTASSEAALTIAANASTNLNSSSLVAQVGEYRVVDSNVTLSTSTIESSATSSVGARLIESLAPSLIESVSSIKIDADVSIVLGASTVVSNANVESVSNVVATLHPGTASSSVKILIGAQHSVSLQLSTLSSFVSMSDFIFPTPESRIYEVQDSDRVFEVPGSDRIYRVLGQDRTWIVRK